MQLDIVRCLEQDAEVAPLSDSIIAAIKESFGTKRYCSALSVCFDGSDYWLFDGYHRLEAMKQAGFNTCEAVIYRGSRRDAYRRYIKDKLRSQGRIQVFKHCIKALSEDSEWSNTGYKTMARLFGRKPEFFENIDLKKTQERPGSLVIFSINKHGTFNLMRRRTHVNRSFE